MNKRLEIELKVFNEILVVAKDIENYHNLNCENTIPIYVKGAKYYSLFSKAQSTILFSQK